MPTPHIQPDHTTRRFTIHGTAPPERMTDPMATPPGAPNLHTPWHAWVETDAPATRL